MEHWEFDKILDGWIQEVIRFCNSREILNEEQIKNKIFDVVDKGWSELGFGRSRIIEWDLRRGIKYLPLLSDVLKYCIKEAWIEDDIRRWNGLEGIQIVAAIAFSSLENVVCEKVRKQKLQHIRNGILAV